MDFFHRAQGKVWMGFSSPTRLCGWDGRTDGAGGGNNLLRHAQFDSDPDPDSFKRRNTAARRRPTQANPVMSASLFWFGRSLDFYFSSCRLPLYTPPPPPLVPNSFPLAQQLPNPSSMPTPMPLGPIGTQVIPVTMRTAANSSAPPRRPRTS